MARKNLMTSTREDRYEKGRQIYYYHDNWIFRVEVIGNYSGNPASLGGIDYDLRILEIIKNGGSETFRVEPEIGLEFRCQKIQNLAAGNNWKLTENLK